MWPAVRVAHAAGSGGDARLGRAAAPLVGARALRWERYSLGSFPADHQPLARSKNHWGLSGEVRPG